MIVWLVTVTGNTTSAAGVYFLARRMGKGILDSRLGRRLLPERTVTKVQREFERHHVWGIFVSRCLPVYRAVVPAFSGVMEVPARRALPAIAAASALFYGLVIWLAYTLGQNWEGVKELLGRIGAGLGIVTLAVTGLLVWYVIQRRRRPPPPPSPARPMPPQPDA